MTAGAGLAAIRVDHPAWCPATCPTTLAAGGVREAVREVVHEVEVFGLDLTLSLAAIATADAAADVRWEAGEGWRPWRLGSTTAVVSIVRIDEWAADGTLTGSSGPTIIVDGPEGLTSLTGREAARLGAALLRAARRLAGGPAPAGRPRRQADRQVRQGAGVDLAGPR